MLTAAAAEWCGYSDSSIFVSFVSSKCSEKCIFILKIKILNKGVLNPSTGRIQEDLRSRRQHWVMVKVALGRGASASGGREGALGAHVTAAGREGAEASNGP